jgi:hypothetical protein
MIAKPCAAALLRNQDFHKGSAVKPQLRGVGHQSRYQIGLECGVSMYS